MSRRLLALVLLLGLAVAACGVSSQDSASKTPTKDVPFGLLDKNRGAAAGNPSGNRDVVIFLTMDGRLIRALRKVRAPVDMDALLDVLKNGPTRAELAAGTRSAVPDDETFRSVALAGGTAVVDLSKPFNPRLSTDQLLALAQIVYTMTSRPGVGQVQFTLNDQSIEIPVVNGTVTSSPVSRDDYASLAPAS